MATIAGHDFIHGRCACGISWLTIRNTQKEDIGQAGIAHAGTMTQTEYNEIEFKRVHEDEAFADSMRMVAAGAGHHAR